MTSIKGFPVRLIHTQPLKLHVKFVAEPSKSILWGLSDPQDSFYNIESHAPLIRTSRRVLISTKVLCFPRWPAQVIEWPNLRITSRTHLSYLVAQQAALWTRTGNDEFLLGLNTFRQNQCQPCQLKLSVPFCFAFSKYRVRLTSSCWHASHT